MLGHNARPVVLVSAGVGVTPMLSMLHALARPAETREAWFIHGARDGRHHPLAAEVHALAEGNERINVHLAFSQPTADDETRGRFHSPGRLDGALIARVVPDIDAEFYLCGPIAFMAELQADLLARGVPAGQIHCETFGPVG